MRIGVNLLFLIPGEVGGSETYVREVLRRAVRSGAHEWVLFANRENDVELCRLIAGADSARVQTVRIRAASRPVRLLAEVFQLPALARRAHLDVLWSPGYTGLPWAPCPQVISILDLQYRQFPQDFSPAARLALQTLVPWTARRAAGILTLSEFARRQILDALRLSPAHVAVTPLAADPSFGVLVPPDERRRRLSGLLPDGPPYVLCVANTYPHKNVPALLDAFARLRERIPHRLVLVGIAGRDEPQVCERMRRMPGRERVLRLHHLSHGQMVALYQGAAAFVFPSLYEGFGLPVLEALQAGTPLVASDAGPIPEVAGTATPCVPGTAEALADALARVLALTPEDRQKRVAEGRRHAARFTWERTAATTLRALETAARAG